MRILALPLILLVAAGPARAQGDPAAELLNQARDAAAKGDPKTAAQRYQDFLQKFATHAQAPAVRVPLAIALLQAPDRDFAKIALLLDQAADDAALADRSAARYWSGTVHREISRRQAAKDAGPETEKAAKRFAEAAESYEALAKDWVDDGKAPLTPAVEGSIHARAGRIEALLALGKRAEASEAARGLEKAKGLARSSSGPAAMYLCGCAYYSADEAVLAGRALVRLAPFDQLLFGAHARFLLARIHHAARETTEALEHYDAVAALFTLQVMAARKLIQSSAPGVKDQPLERARLEALANGPAPEFVGDALLDAGSLLYENKRFVEAQDRLAKFIQQNPKHSRLDEGRYLAGIAAVQAGKPAEAVGALQPLLAHPRLGPQARAWTGRALVKAADPAKPDDVKAALGKAAELFRLAAEETAKRPEGAAAAGELQFEMGDALQRSGKVSEAIAAYRKAAGSSREEEAAVRLIGCLQLSGDARQAEEAFRRFEKDHPRSSFMPEALFHYAECGYASAQGAGDSAAHRAVFEEAMKRYDLLLAKYPDSPAGTLCRFRIAMSRHALGQYAESAAALAAIPENDRSGPLAGASYILADSLLRSGPPVRETQDALSASARLQQLTLAIGALRAFIGSQPQSPEAPEATIKLGFALQQVAWLQADPQERVKAAGSAREVYEGFRTAYPTHPLRATAEYERANCYALAGDAASALTKLPRFHAEPFVKSPIAPIAMLREAQILRSLNRFPEAAAVMAQARQLHEEALKKDDARAAWVPLLRYHHGVCLREAKQNAEAIKIFQSVTAEYPASEWAKASKEMLEETK